MVDFNNETTVTVPPSDLVKIAILQRRYDLLEAYEDYKKNKLRGANITLSIVKARLITFFLEVQACFRRRLHDKKNEPNIYEKIKTLCFNNDIIEEEVLEAIFLINEELDNMKLIVPDTAKSYDSRRVEVENKEKGY